MYRLKNVVKKTLVIEDKIMQIDNALIMAAGLSSRFAPLSYEIPKGLIEVKGEVLIERQIKQLHSAGIDEVYVITGYMADKFQYLVDNFNVKLIHNPNYITKNNNASIWAARNIINNTYICSADNYFPNNPFTKTSDTSYYSGIYSPGYTKEWCMYEDKQGYINKVTIGGNDAWFMLGHAFWDSDFSHAFLKILSKEYFMPKTYGKLWEHIFIEHLDTLKMKIMKYDSTDIFEFDTLDELREFDASYLNDSHSAILKEISTYLKVPESNLTSFMPVQDNGISTDGFEFICKGHKYQYCYANKELSLLL